MNTLQEAFPVQIGIPSIPEFRIDKSFETDSDIDLSAQSDIETSFHSDPETESIDYL